jgi:hypothetical protein
MTSPRSNAKMKPPSRAGGPENNERGSRGLIYSILRSDAMTRRLCDIIRAVAVCFAVIALGLALIALIVLVSVPAHPIILGSGSAIVIAAGSWALGGRRHANNTKRRSSRTGQQVKRSRFGRRRRAR